MDRLCRDVRLRYKHRNDHDDDDDDDYNPSLNIKSDFIPPPSDNVQLEEALERFGNEIGKLYSSHSNGRGSRPTNLDAQQLNVIQQLRHNDEITVCEADKNLGPCTIERSTYIERALEDHLLDEKTYRRLTEEEASIHLKKVQYQVESLVLRAGKEGLASAELKYLNRALKLVHRLPQFYLLMKIHKTPWKTRPVVSTCGSLCYFLGKWVDYHLQPVAKLVPTYIRDSEELMTKLKQLGRLDPRAKLFTTDAVSMYTNIDTDHALQQLKVAFDRLKDKLSPDFPADLVLEALSIIMKNNVFQFGDTFWLQLNGTAMGTPPACTWATIYYGVHESVCLLANFGQNLLYCGRFIDDMLGIWIPDDNNPNAWEEFKNSLPFGLLEWETSELSTSVDFLDLTISIGSDRRIQFQTYQKPMNLYLYIPYGSAHAPGVLRSLIFGNLRKYLLQNSKKEDYQAITLLFYDRIVARGHDPAMVKDMFLDAAKRLDDIAAGKIRPKAKVDRNQQLFFHTEYHPSISRQAIRQAYESATNNFADVDGIDIRQFTVALSRPQNLRDLLISSRLHEAPGREVSTHLPSQSITNHGQPRSSS